MGETVKSFVPDLNAHNMELPCSAVTGITCTAGSLVTLTSSNPTATQQLLAYYPTTGLGADTGSGTAAYTAVGNNPVNEDYLLARLDQKLGAKDDFFLRVVRDSGIYDEPFPLYTRSQGGVPGETEDDNSTTYYVTLQEKRMISPSLINVIRYGFTRTATVASPTPRGGILNSFPGRNTDAGVAVTGIGSLGTGNTVPMVQVQNKFPLDEQLYWTHGAHDVRFGGSFMRVQNRSFMPISNYYSGGWTFQGMQQLLQNNCYQFAGAPDGFDNFRRVFHEWDYALYIQDNWKLRRNLTLNVGVRYDPMSNPTGPERVLEAIIHPLTDTVPTVVSHVFQSNPSLKNIEPRIGLAYSPFGDDKTVIHAGFGMFDDPPKVWIYGGNYNNGPPTVETLNQIPATFPTPFSAATAPGKLSISGGTAYNLCCTPYLMQWNLRIERNLGGGLIASAGYVGSRANHLLNAPNTNPPGYTINSSGQMVFNGILTNPAFSTLGGTRTPAWPTTIRSS